jgi:hypothetical protein
MKRVTVRYRVKPGIRERCDEAPVVTELDEIGSFRMLGS